MLLDLLFSSSYNDIQKRQALLLREAVMRLEAEWSVARRELEEAEASLRAEVGLLQATSGKAAGWQSQARSSITNQAPSAGLQQAPADGTGVFLSEVRVWSCAVSGQSRDMQRKEFRSLGIISEGG